MKFRKPCDNFTIWKILIIFANNIRGTNDNVEVIFVTNSI